MGLFWSIVGLGHIRVISGLGGIRSHSTDMDARVVILDLLLVGKGPLSAAFACSGPRLRSGVDYHNPCVSLTRARAEVYSSTSIHLGISGSGDLGISGSGISGSEDLRI